MKMRRTRPSQLSRRAEGSLCQTVPTGPSASGQVDTRLKNDYDDVRVSSYTSMNYNCLLTHTGCGDGLHTDNL